FHVEVDQPMISSWLRDYLPEGREEMLATHERQKAAFNAQAKNIFRGFLRRTQERIHGSSVHPQTP
ncbi:MAG: hypothetical protein PHG72_02655, partial [Candidatus Omnitrophica bacterium]|nr:hypothetical protein [Candidatus Omnitrophota bacterium]